MRYSLIQENYSYFIDLIGSNLEALKAGKIDTIIVINIEQIDTINIDDKFISEGILLKKYISSGNKLILNIELNNCLKFSIYIEKVTPKKIPKIVADVPIITPIKKIF